MLRALLGMRRASAITALVVLTAGCAVSQRKPGDPIKPGFNIYSAEQDIQLGQQAAQEYLKQVQLVRDERLQSYVNGIVQRLASQPEAGKYPYKAYVIADDSINASALPGGPMFVHTGLIKAADNEAELAGVLAHEMSHVALRHGTNQASKSQLLSIPAILAGTALGGGIGGQLGQAAVGLGTNLLFLKYSRDAENQADLLGARIMNGAGYNPIAMARFFEKLKSEGGQRAPQFLSDHPDPGNREAAVQREIQGLPRGNYQSDNGQFQYAKQAAEAVRAPSRQQQQQAVQAAQQGGPPPSEIPSTADLQPLDVGPLQMQIPQGWRAFYDRSSNVVTVAPNGGIVQGPNGYAIGQGVVISAFRPSQSNNLQQAAQELVSQLQNTSRGLRQSGRWRRALVNGQQGVVTQLQGTSPYGGVERITLVALPYQNQLMYLAFVGPGDNYQRLTPTYEAMLRSVRLR